MVFNYEQVTLDRAKLGRGMEAIFLVVKGERIGTFYRPHSKTLILIRRTEGRLRKKEKQSQL